MKKNKFTAARKVLDLLSGGKIEGVADLIRSAPRFSESQLEELADLFDHTLPYTFSDQYKLILKNRVDRNRTLAPNYAKKRAFYFGSEIHRVRNRAAVSGTKISRKEAIYKIWEYVGPTEYGEIPSIKTLERDYDYYRLVLKVNKQSHIIKFWPPITKKKSSSIT